MYLISLLKVKYAGDDNYGEWKKREGFNQMAKTLTVRGARISYCIWEVAGKGEKKNTELWLYFGDNFVTKTIIKLSILYMNDYEFAGDGKSEEQISIACKDSVAILIMFDLTSRCTLNKYVLDHVTANFLVMTF